MNKREKIIFCVKLLLELVVFVLLILTIIYLTSSDNGIEEQINKTSTYNRDSTKNFARRHILHDKSRRIHLPKWDGSN